MNNPELASKLRKALQTKGLKPIAKALALSERTILTVAAEYESHRQTIHWIEFRWEHVERLPAKDDKSATIEE